MEHPICALKDYGRSSLEGGEGGYVTNETRRDREVIDFTRSRVKNKA